ncbi:MAG: hypothetical protein KC910_14895 [Candidatus Eremiobacteraeota bacterium]|nr:hypothetical protein [Candidatus Eremiobacteraeota bacterium]
MEQYPNSPYHIAATLVQQFDQGQLDPPAFLSNLDQFEAQVKGWYEQLDQIQVGDEASEEQQLMEDAKDSLELVYEAVELLRGYARDRNPEAAAEALRLADEGSRVMAELIGITEDNMDRLENDFTGGSIVG